ncbi:MAG: T9SS type A sorting domain-containing protein [Bacteroidetes bacterium]|nr:T9SS type A sorting domain-containing protein [Bacteroidota bacterium]
MKTKIKFLFALGITTLNGFSQFPGTPETIGTSAMYKDSSAFTAWASGCIVQRGYQNVLQTNLGYASAGLDTNGTKKAGENGTVSFGDGGSAILTFNNPITNGIGPDFAVFENAFNNLFLELAFVEVSSDGVNFFRFPATSNTQTLTQIGGFDQLGDATKLNNLAGKYRLYYGTPFDLDELKNIAGLNINHVTHVKIIDVVGCVSSPYATYDSQGNAINDPFPTPFATGGFDLDAVGVINQVQTGVLEQEKILNNITIYPQPCNNELTISSPLIDIKNIFIYAVDNKLIYQQAVNQKYTQLNLYELASGFYTIKFQFENNTIATKKVLKN